jgi:hypothetical protein
MDISSRLALAAGSSFFLSSDLDETSEAIQFNQQFFKNGGRK